MGLRRTRRTPGAQSQRHAFTSCVPARLLARRSVHLHPEDYVVSGPFAVVSPDTPHAFEAGGLVALLFIEPEGRAGRSLMQLMQGRRAAPINAERRAMRPTSSNIAFDHPHRSGTALRDRESRSRTASQDAPAPVEPDRRVPNHQMGERRADGPLAINGAARRRRIISKPGKSLVCRRDGFRSALMCCRCGWCGGRCAYEGLSLTDAAQEAGFADSAHFSRTFKRMFGLPAASLEMSSPYRPGPSPSAGLGMRLSNRTRAYLTSGEPSDEPKTKMTAAGCGCSATSRCSDRCRSDPANPLVLDCACAL